MLILNLDLQPSTLLLPLHWLLIDTRK